MRVYYLILICVVGVLGQLDSPSSRNYIFLKPLNSAPFSFNTIAQVPDIPNNRIDSIFWQTGDNGQNLKFPQYLGLASSSDGNKITQISHSDPWKNPTERSDLVDPVYSDHFQNNYEVNSGLSHFGQIGGHINPEYANTIPNHMSASESSFSHSLESQAKYGDLGFSNSKYNHFRNNEIDVPEFSPIVPVDYLYNIVKTLMIQFLQNKKPKDCKHIPFPTESKQFLHEEMQKLEHDLLEKIDQRLGRSGATSDVRDVKVNDSNLQKIEEDLADTSKLFKDKNSEDKQKDENTSDNTEESTSTIEDETEEKIQAKNLDVDSEEARQESKGLSVLPLSSESQIKSEKNMGPNKLNDTQIDHLIEKKILPHLHHHLFKDLTPLLRNYLKNIIVMVEQTIQESGTHNLTPKSTIHTNMDKPDRRSTTNNSSEKSNEETAEIKKHNLEKYIKNLKIDLKLNINKVKYRISENGKEEFTLKPLNIKNNPRLSKILVNVVKQALRRRLQNDPKFFKALLKEEKKENKTKHIKKAPIRLESSMEDTQETEEMEDNSGNKLPELNSEEPSDETEHFKQNEDNYGRKLDDLKDEKSNQEEVWEEISQVTTNSVSSTSKPKSKHQDKLEDPVKKYVLPYDAVEGPNASDKPKGSSKTAPEKTTKTTTTEKPNTKHPK